MLAVAFAVFAATGRPAGGADLIVHAEAGTTHRILASHRADEPFNPASVIKVATSLAALETLGPDHRWTTEFACSGPCTVSDGILDGDLVIFGSGDPDFQAENAWLVARRLGERGIRSISGDLVVRGVFFMGWEHGVEKRETDPDRRAQLMGGRFVQALDRSRWNRTLEASWEDAAPRHGWALDTAPRITIAGSVRRGTGEDISRPLIRHRSNPLRVTLKRFNTYSNNDIVRIGDFIGGENVIENLLKELTAGLPGEVSVSAASGERFNRLTARQVVRLLWTFDARCRHMGLEPADILPVPGCVSGSLPRMFPRLSAGNAARTTVVKSGTLTTTDGGVCVLAGFFRTPEDETVAFCIAGPRAGGKISAYRRAEESRVLDLMRTVGGARPRPCGPPEAFSDTLAKAEIIGQTAPNEDVEDERHAAS